MNRAIGSLNQAERDSLFPEFRENPEQQDGAEDENTSLDQKRSRKDPLILSVMARLAQVLREETAAIRTGDFEAFTELQRQKGTLIRQAERLQTNRSAIEAVESMEPETLKARLEEFNGTVESNMRTIGAVKDAITHVRHQAIKKLEEEKGDGVYSKDGERKSLHRVSLNETRVKL